MTHYPFFGFPAVYVDPVVVVFACDPPFAEMGSTVNVAVLRWSLSKTPLSLKLDGVLIYPNALCADELGPFTTNQLWTLQMTDAEKSASAKATLQFLNKSYWGSVVAAPVSSADILAMDQSFFATGSSKMILYGSPTGKFPCFAFPARFGAPRKVQIGTQNQYRAPDIVWVNFTGFTATTVAFTNASGFTENYTVLTFDEGSTEESLLVAWK